MTTNPFLQPLQPALAPLSHLPTMAYPPSLTIEPFLFSGTISGHSVITNLLDSGATTNFISLSFLEKHP